MRKNIIIVIALIAGLGLLFSFGIQSDDSTAPTTNETTQSEARDDVISYQGETGKNALELLKTKADVTTQSSDFGEYVTAINGIGDDTDGKYWLFYINGESAQVGAADYVTTDNDTIEWRYE